MLVPKGTFVMVVDGAHCVVYCNEGEAMAPDLVLVEQAHQPSLRNGELATDRPGRHFESVGARRGGYEETDFHQQEEDRFAIEAAERLNALAERRSPRLILIAAPPVLGVIRPRLSRAAQDALAAEIDKDYAQRPPRDIAELLIKFED